MRITAVILLCCCLLTGCKAEDQLLDKALALRESILTSSRCAFTAVITADYSNAIYTFQIDCEEDSMGNVMAFTVTDPDSISGITGQISRENAALTFDDRVLVFSKLAEEQLVPVTGPWIFLHALKSGYLTGCGREVDGYCIYLDDSYEENLLYLQIYTDDSFVPTRAEIIYKDRRVLTMDIKNFTLQ